MKYTIEELSQQDIQIIMAGLAELPLKASAGIYGRIAETVKKQDEANAVPVDGLIFPKTHQQNGV